MSPATILVVEDEPYVLEVVSLLLEDAAYRVVQATSGKAALSTLQVTEPDLIISDVVMPGMDGFAFFEQVRADADQSQIPFMFLTSLDQKTAVRQGMGLGADDYLTKPFEPEDLLSVGAGYPNAGLPRARIKGAAGALAAGTGRQGG